MMPIIDSEHVGNEDGNVWEQLEVVKTRMLKERNFRWTSGCCYKMDRQEKI